MLLPGSLSLARLHGQHNRRHWLYFCLCFHVLASGLIVYIKRFCMGQVYGVKCLHSLRSLCAGLAHANLSTL